MITKKLNEKHNFDKWKRQRNGKHYYVKIVQ